jgi:hypothetical protein
MFNKMKDKIRLLLREELNDFDPFAHSGYEEPEEMPEESICVLGMSKGNAKLDWPYMSLPAGYTCPRATICKNFAARPGTKFKDGKSVKRTKDTKFMCYAASQQARHSNTAGKNAFNNLDLLVGANKSGGVKGMTKLIIDSLKYYGFDKVPVFRIHEGGDFFSNDYMKAWIEVAKAIPGTTFYTHTTSLQFWLNNKSSIPRNMKLIASLDENNESLIMSNNLRYARVVYSVEEAKELRLPIDYDDTIACCSDENFALLIHGQQPAGSKASKALSKNKKAGIYDKLKNIHKSTKGKRLDIINKMKDK